MEDYSKLNNAKILILTNNIGGLYNFRKEVVEALVKAKSRVYISHPDDDFLLSYFKELGCTIIPLEFERRGINPFNDLKLVYDYFKLLKYIKPDVVLSYTIKPNIYGGIACSLCGVPQLPNITGLGDAVENGGVLQKIIILLYKIGLKKSRSIFFQNKSNLEFFTKNKILNTNFILLPGSGVNLNFHVYQDYPKSEIVKFLFIARLIKDKGVDEYLNMARVIKDKYPSTEFQILGSIDGNYESNIKELVQKNIIKYLGTTKDVRPFLRDVHCTILPSYHEGMSNVNLESQANGRPVITTNVPGCRETIEDNITGYIVTPRSSIDLIDKVEKFLHLPADDKMEMGVLGRKNVENKFSRQIVVDKYLEEISSILKNDKKI